MRSEGKPKVGLNKAPWTKNTYPSVTKAGWLILDLHDPDNDDEGKAVQIYYNQEKSTMVRVYPESDDSDDTCEGLLLFGDRKAAKELLILIWNERNEALVGEEQ